MPAVYHSDLVQGTQEWLDARRGLLTASELCRIITPGTLKAAANEKARMHVWEIAAQRITQRVEEGYQGDAMIRGHAEEAEARYLYAQYYERVETCGFVTNDRWGFTLGCSPDGLVGEDGVIECKSRIAKYQVQTVVEGLALGIIPEEFRIQVQAELLVTERKWCDFISYSNGLPMVTIRVEPDPEYQKAILEAAATFEKQVALRMLAWGAAMISGARLIHPEYTAPQEEMFA
jgi:predicted phage-related endonuclease